VVPAWSLALAFVAGLVVGAVGCLLIMGRGRSAEIPALAAPTGPEPAAASATPGSPTLPEPEPKEEAAEEQAEAPAEEQAKEPAEEQVEEPAEVSAEAPAEIPASAVDNVVAELERRVKGRRTEGEADRTTGGRRGRSE
jgi:outer membrane biosynthesis protein TonB